MRQWVTYKLAVQTHKVRTTATPTYLSELVQTHAPPRVLLRSSDAPMLVVPRIHTELARRAFSVAAPSTWNSLSAEIRQCENILTLKHFQTPLENASIQSASVSSDLNKSVIIYYYYNINIGLQFCTTSADLVRNIFLKQPFSTKSSELNC